MVLSYVNEALMLAWREYWDCWGSERAWLDTDNAPGAGALVWSSIGLLYCRATVATGSLLHDSTMLPEPGP